ncbi:aldose 1-epimerase family protein [Skermania sp. ID1734]|uniref:aldose 1-epimerase family protein n=1 Tax=Skermania sp. ID1734 TaxID=2597516 RepID=UPI00117EA870|nr:aldose 1-epimerase family protein [Skermania sp. ID1734]TSD96633.1 aldose 1-epimerase family protein [Skermania sp. ID1734]
MTGTFPIESAGYRAEIVATGAGLRMLEATVDGQPYPLTETWPAGTKPPLSAGLILVPWPNRVRDGEYIFDGVEYQLEITEPARHNASHGLCRRRDWDLDEHTESAVRLSIDVGQHPGWPFSLRVAVRYELSDDGLTVTHYATNTGEQRSPYGLGMHSFVRAGDTPLDDCTLELSARSYQPMEPERMLPEGPVLPVQGTEYDFTSPRKLAGVWMDTPFTSVSDDENGQVCHTLRAPDGTGAVLWTDPAFAWVQAFTADPDHDQAYPNRGRALAIEPMTCPPNAFNSGTDLIVLEPGESWQARWGLRNATLPGRKSSDATSV